MNPNWNRSQPERCFYHNDLFAKRQYIWPDVPGLRLRLICLGRMCISPLRVWEVLQSWENKSYETRIFGDWRPSNLINSFLPPSVQRIAGLYVRICGFLTQTDLAFWVLVSSVKCDANIWGRTGHYMVELRHSLNVPSNPIRASCRKGLIKFLKVAHDFPGCLTVLNEVKDIVGK